METVQTILVIVLLAVWSCFSISILITSIQNLIYDRRREKREIEKEKRDLEYHEKRMNDFK
ncbi:MAG: hypothetical protein U0I35_08715 [Dorea formicigenerans]|jgi:hypothetical protein|nr:hypothetical protein [Dorea formicigenerans]DAQ50442.1 MAG TPA: holin [Caudoviricetes sp.]